MKLISLLASLTFFIAATQLYCQSPSLNDQGLRFDCSGSVGDLALDNLCVGGTGSISNLIVDGQAQLNEVIISGPVSITSLIPSTNCTNGAFIVDGGIGINGDLNTCGAGTFNDLIVTNSFSAPNFNTNLTLCNLSVGDNTNPITNGTSNTALGENALQNNITGIDNTALGCNALQQNTIGTDNTALGNVALLSNTQGFQNVAVGSMALQNAVTATNNIAIGFQAAQSVTDSSNVAIGTQALANGSGVNNNNVAIGSGLPMRDAVNSTFNVAVGAAAMRTVTGAANNVAVGRGPLQNSSTPSNCIAIGVGALNPSTNPSECIGFGHSVLANCSGCSETIAIGHLTFSNGATDSGSIAIGSSAMRNPKSSSNNIAIGVNALQGNTKSTSVTNNIAIGNKALFNASGTTGVIAIGNSAGFNLVASEASDIYIGNNGLAHESNTIRIGGAQTACFVAGIFGATSPSGATTPVVINNAGQLGTVSSALRYKKDINTIGTEHEKLLQLRPVTFTYKSDDSNQKRYGLVAEEVYKLYPEIIVYDENGQIFTLDYMEIIPLLIKQIQVLEEKNILYQQQLNMQADYIERLAERIVLLEENAQQIDELKNLIYALMAMKKD
jgi:trimeric autotransporter adhesin